ncbi:divalent metal cation transporter [Botrimarina hoheduenensis]|uniref:Natural resistance-associated macrophage protein n=1 Tax=Botrimarina hoheduenensis TaxID=2528000 RepID=A0A5C5WCM7_9BACT|nr:divalent metal cation transporter [Botrimarina hoheduenensis]TWT48297.1 Natural resistance-associated macrophage protein [Botrimarina hoheduenensis]
MAETNDRLAHDRAVLQGVADKGPAAKAGAYLRLSGPGWLQSAITLGGGSLAGGLYLGVLSGYGLMWLQPVAMLMGVAMLGAIAYVTLSTGRRPFRLVTEEVNPVLGWGWAIATLMANVVWCLPQFGLGTAAITQNLAPEMLGETPTGKVFAVAILAVVALATIISYERGGRGMKIFENILKLLVGIIVLCFIGVVVKLTGVEGGIDWPAVWRGFVPDWESLSGVPAVFREGIAATGAAGEGLWSKLILASRQDVILTAAATAVGINMTFLLPNSLLDRGWDRPFRGLALFDLSIGLFVPFLIATACVVMAASAQFHGKYNEALVAAEPTPVAAAAVASGKSAGEYLGLLDKRLAWEHGAEQLNKWADAGAELIAQRAALPLADKQMAATLVQRDADDLANALEPLVGAQVAQLVFGIGVVSMALSTIVVLMLINGYVVCEVFGAPHRGMIHFLGSLLPLVFGAIAPFVWQKAMFWLAVPTSVFGMVLLPIAYVTFLMLINSRRVLGDAALSGVSRVVVNAILGLALLLATVGACTSIYSKAGWYGFAAAGAFIAAALLMRRKPTSTTA